MKNKFLSTLMGGAAFAMLTLNACTNDILETADESKPVGDSKEVMFIANNFVGDGGAESRTLITDGKFAWTEGDTIGILPDKGSQVYFEIDNISETEANKAVFTGGAWGLKADNNYAAYYPFIQDIMLNRTAVPVDYSAQTYSAREDGKVSPSHDYMAAMPVAREDGGLNFQFKHLGALVEVQFTLPEGESGAIKQLTLCADKAIFPLLGTFDLTADAVAITPAEGKEAYTVKVNVENLTAEAGELVSVFFMMPPMATVATDTWKAMVVYGENNTRLPLEISTKKTELKAGYYYTLKTNAIELPESVEITDYWTLSTNVNDALGALGGTKLRFVTGSAMVSETEVYSDDYEVKAYAMRNGDWLEVHTLAKSFKLPEQVQYMFDASQFTNYSTLNSLDLSGFDTSSVTNMSRMFIGCSSLNSLDLSSFETSSVENMSCMFESCSSLPSLDLSGFDTSSVTDMYGMFFTCQSLTSLDVSGFNTSSVTDMSNMFDECSSLPSLDLSGFNTSSVTDMSNMFWNCYALENLDLSGFAFRSDGECNYESMFGYVGVNTCNWGEEEPKTVIYVKSQEDINLLTGLGLNDYLWLDYATLQVKPSQSAE